MCQRVDFGLSKSEGIFMSHPPEMEEISYDYLGRKGFFQITGLSKHHSLIEKSI